MLLRFGVSVLLLCSVSCSSLSSDDEVARWALGLKKETETVTEVLDLTPTFLKSSIKGTKSAPPNIQIECLLDDGRKGVCVPHYQCNENKNVINDGTTLIDFRGNKKCPSILEVCCVLQTTEIESYDEYMKQNRHLKDSYDMKMMQTGAPDECGWTNVRSISPDKTKTHQGTEQAIFEEFRWMIAIIKKRKMSTAWVPDDYIGGGSLIHPSVVITAAHNVNGTRNRELKCRAGEFNIQTESESYKFQEQDIKKKIIHPDYLRQSLLYDVALIFLKERFDLEAAPHIGLACLNKVLPKPDTTCYTMGWGTLVNEKKYATALKKIKVPLVSPDVCQTQLQATRLGPYFRLHPSLTCAGGQEGVDSCHKDGGSSLVCPIQENDSNVRYAVVGMVAYGIGCGIKDRPGVYVNVPAIYSWVDKVMTDEKYGNVTYAI